MKFRFYYGPDDLISSVDIVRCTEYDYHIERIGDLMSHPSDWASSNRGKLHYSWFHFL